MLIANSDRMITITIVLAIAHSVKRITKVFSFIRRHDLAIRNKDSNINNDSNNERRLTEDKQARPKRDLEADPKPKPRSRGLSVSNGAAKQDNSSRTL